MVALTKKTFYSDYFAAANYIENCLVIVITANWPGGLAF